MKICVAGGGGFLGGHLCKRLADDGHDVTAVDIRNEENYWQRDPRVKTAQFDLREAYLARAAVVDAEWVINLAAEMGGMGYISTHDADCLTNVLINTNLLRASVAAGVGRYFFASSACAYSKDLQNESDYEYGLEESDVQPFNPDSFYGWEKLFSEFVTSAYARDYGLDVRIARIHNCYGPHGDWWSGREKAPAALCRKIATAKLTGAKEIEIWGDGEQTRSFMYVDDCVEGILRLMNSTHKEPINLGSEECVTINHLSSMVQDIASYQVEHKYIDGPQGVRGRSSDNTKIKEVLGWEPEMRLFKGLSQTYPWVEDQVRASLK